MHTRNFALKLHAVDKFYRIRLAYMGKGNILYARSSTKSSIKVRLIQLQHYPSLQLLEVRR